MTVCDICGHKGVEGETFFIFIDPDSDWWLHLMGGPMYCEKCAETHRREIRMGNNKAERERHL